jgi:hypothetical protein
MTRSTTILLCIATLGLASPVAADSKDKPPAARTLTGKERLGPKWSDEQRIDNCNVPVDKRGTKPRVILCPHHLTN